MNGLCLAGGRLGESLCRTSRRSRKGYLESHAVKDMQQCAHNGGLTRPGTSREQHNTALKGCKNSTALLFCVLNAALAFLTLDKGINVFGVHHVANLVKKRQLARNVSLVLKGLFIVNVMHPVGIDGAKLFLFD